MINYNTRDVDGYENIHNDIYIMIYPLVLNWRGKIFESKIRLLKK